MSVAGPRTGGALKAPSRVVDRPNLRTGQICPSVVGMRSDFADVDLYEVLGVDPDATVEVLKKAQRAQQKKHHPDAGGDTEQSQLINLAFEILSDPIARAAYDRGRVGAAGRVGHHGESAGSSRHTGGRREADDEFLARARNLYDQVYPDGWPQKPENPGRPVDPFAETVVTLARLVKVQARSLLGVGLVGLVAGFYSHGWFVQAASHGPIPVPVLVHGAEFVSIAVVTFTITSAVVRLRRRLRRWLHLGTALGLATLVAGLVIGGLAAPGPFKGSGLPGWPTAQPAASTAEAAEATPCPQGASASCAELLLAPGTTLESVCTGESIPPAVVGPQFRAMREQASVRDTGSPDRYSDAKYIVPIRLGGDRSPANMSVHAPAIPPEVISAIRDRLCDGTGNVTLEQVLSTAVNGTVTTLAAPR